MAQQKKRPSKKRIIPPVAGGADRPSLPPLEELLNTETENCTKFLASAKSKTPLRLPVRELVARSMSLHQNLIQRWGGFEFTGPSVVLEDLGAARLLAEHEYHVFYRQYASTLRNAMQSDSAAMPWRVERVNPHIIIENESLGRHSVFGPGVIFSTKEVQDNYKDENGYTWRAREADKVRIVLGTGINGTPIYSFIRIGQRIPPVIMKLLSDYEAPNCVIREWETFFQRLGENVWTSQKHYLCAALSCAPSAILRLGHYGEDSCYRNGGAHDYSKFWLAVDCPDSFVMLFRREASKLPVARAWGVACLGRGALLSNFYLLPRNMLLPAASEAVKLGLGLSSVRDASSGKAWMGFAGQFHSMYINSDSILLTLTNRASQTLLDRYLAGIFDVSGHYGIFTGGGYGPRLMQVSQNKFKLMTSPDVTRHIKRHWPYKHIDMHAIAQDLAADKGIFKLTDP